MHFQSRARKDYVYVGTDNDEPVQSDRQRQHALADEDFITATKTDCRSVLRILKDNNHTAVVNLLDLPPFKSNPMIPFVATVREMSTIQCLVGGK